MSVTRRVRGVKRDNDMGMEEERDEEGEEEHQMNGQKCNCQ